MAEQITMDDILDEKPKEIKETVKEGVKEVQQEKPVQVETKAAELSIRGRHRDKEQDSQGRVRDPETGQYVEKKQEVKPEIKAEVKEEKKEERLDKQELKSEEKKPAAPQQEFTDKEKAFLRAAEEERRKRQELERRLAELEAKSKAPPESKETPKGFWDDPEGVLQANFAKIREDVSREIIASRLNTSEIMARKKYDDFDDKVKVFGEIMQRTPGLYQHWINTPDPAEYAYSLAKQHIDLQEAGSIPELREKIEKEVRLKVEQELKDKAEALVKERAAIPPSLGEAQSKGGNKVVWGGPPSFEDILHG